MQLTAKGSRQKKSLSLLPAIPLDVLFEVKKTVYRCYSPTLTCDQLHEVFSNLTPMDIIHVSQTSRIFRDTLMKRNATSVWKAARERFGAPECPSTMSEPQWAVFLFGNLCQVCKRYILVKASQHLFGFEWSPRIVVRKAYRSPILPSCVGFA